MSNPRGSHRMNLPEFALLGGICFLVVFGCREKPLSSETDSILQALDREIGLPPALKTDLIPTKSPDTQQRQASFDTWIPEDELPSLQWEIVYLRNLPVGYIRRNIEVATQDRWSQVMQDERYPSEQLLFIEAESRVRIKRQDGADVDQMVFLSTIEKLNGELVGLEGRIDGGSTASQFTGKVTKGFLNLSIVTNKQPSSLSIPWGPSDRGPFAIEESLRQQPMQPGEVRLVRFLDPFQMAITESRLEALSPRETIDVNGSLVSLLEVENRSITSGRSDMSILWLDENGIQRKSYEPASDRQNFDCDPTTARYVISREEFEANSFKEIPLLGTLPKIPDGDSTVFQITSSAFLNSKNSISNRTNQKVNQINDTSIEVEVYRVLSDLASDPLQFNTSKPEQDPVSEDALLNRGIIDWKGVSFQRWLGAVANDDRKLLGKTPSTAGDFQQRAKLARKWITSSIERIPMDRTPQSPSQTAKELSGDRLDHAIMLVATLRALSVPARIAVGFQAEPSTVRPTVAFHAWAEYHDSERWIPIDSTISTETVPADRWKVTESTLPSPNSYDTFILATRFLIDTQVAVRSRR